MPTSLLDTSRIEFDNFRILNPKPGAIVQTQHLQTLSLLANSELLGSGT